MLAEDAAVDARPLPDVAPYAAIAFVVPWMAVSAFLPDPWRVQSWALLCVLAVLLVAASSWSLGAARERGLDEREWAFAAVVSFGLAMLPLLAKPRQHGALTFACSECGRRGAMVETFCHGCGAA